METITLKEHITRAKNLESAIFAQELLIQKIDTLPPLLLPEKEFIPEPKEPIKPLEAKEFTKSHTPENQRGLLGGTIAVLILSIIIIIIDLAINEIGFFFWVCIVACILSLIMLPIALRDKQNLNLTYQNEVEQYNLNLSNYFREMEDYNNKCKQAEALYLEKYDEYLINSKKRALFIEKIKNNLYEGLSQLKNSLYLHYQQNIIFPKYRNFIAITSIEEYLQCGRCETLEGPNGAYNLFEYELRQDLIIEKLSTITSNLEKIRNNQYTLYQELKATNTLIDSLIQEVVSLEGEIQLNTHYARVSALCAASPKVTHGIIYPI